MIATTLVHIARVIEASVELAAAERIVSGAVRIDSRDIEPGDLFLAIEGGHVDGHDFLAQAHDRGAVAAIVDRLIDDAPNDLPQLIVQDTVAALTALARDHARRLTAAGTTIIGITGSSGKTTTKDLIAQVLETAGSTIAPPGSFNNEIGLPTTVLRADDSTAFLVLEMGARGVGHIAHLVDIGAPRIGVVLNVGSAHAGEFGGREATARAKGELVEGLPEGGTAILNGDDPLVAAMVQRTRAHVLLFGEGESCDVRAIDVVMDSTGCASFTLVVGGDEATVALASPGQHMVSNALAAAAAATACGQALPAIAQALTAARPRSPWRMEVVRTMGGPVIVNDAYNANPESVGAALASVSLMHRQGRLWVVLGEMLELGDERVNAHRTIGAQAVEAGADHVVAVGDAVIAGALADGVASESSLRGSSARVTSVADAAGAVDALSEVGPGDVVLIKASRGIGLESVAQALSARFGATAGGVA